MLFLTDKYKTQRHQSDIELWRLVQSSVARSNCLQVTIVTTLISHNLFLPIYL